MNTLGFINLLGEFKATLSESEMLYVRNMIKYQYDIGLVARAALERLRQIRLSDPNPVLGRFDFLRGCCVGDPLYAGAACDRLYAEARKQEVAEAAIQGGVPLRATTPTAPVVTDVVGAAAGAASGAGASAGASATAGAADDETDMNDRMQVMSLASLEELGICMQHENGYPLASPCCL